MTCSQCGANNSDEAIFCQKCGKRFETTGQNEPTFPSPLPVSASPYEKFSYTVPASSETNYPLLPPSTLYKSTSNPYEPKPPLRPHSNRRYLIVIAVLVAMLIGVGSFELGQLLKGNSQGNTTTTAPTAIPSTPPGIYHVVVNAIQGFPGMDTGVNLRSGDRLTIKASGLAIFSPPPNASCNSGPTNPDGVIIVNGTPCSVSSSSSNSVYPPAPVGTLLARIGPVGTMSSTGWFVVGSSFSSTVVIGGELYLIYNDGYYDDNSGSYQVTITVERG